MAVIVSQSIKRKEFKRGIIPESDLKTILESFQKGVFTIIKGKNLPHASRLIKIYATTVAGARRIVYLVDVKSNDAFFLFYRTKKDKIGQNISIQNPEFRKLLHTYLMLLEADIESGELKTYNI